MHSNNNPNISLETINKSSCVIVKVRVGLIGFELVKEGGEVFNIVSNCCGLVDMEHLTQQPIVLVTQPKWS